VPLHQCFARADNPLGSRMYLVPSAARLDKFPDMGSPETKIAIALGHVEDSRRLVEQQRELIASHGASSDAVALLKTFEQCLETFEAVLDRLLKESGHG
jgi:hypothetical protein